MNLNYIELFAGCGGMSLGLEASGFELCFANEFSPMAGETFAFNLLGENLRECKDWRKTIWIRSLYENGNIKRLSEDPRDYQKSKKREFYEKNSLHGKLIIGDIQELITNNILLVNVSEGWILRQIVLLG